MFWVMQNNIYDEEGYTTFIDALVRLNIPHAIVNMEPVFNTIKPEIYPPAGPVVVMGTYSLARLAKERGWMPGSFINDNLNYRTQIKHWGQAMLNHDAEFYSLGDVPEQIEPFFIRPIHDSKSFVGQILDWPTMLDWRSNPPYQTIDLKTEVMICKKKDIYRETRTWIVDKKVVTASTYKARTRRYGTPEYVDQAVIDFANEQAEKWSPIRAFVMDVAETSQGHRIVEINNINSAGFYKGDVEAIIVAMEKAFN